MDSRARNKQQFDVLYSMFVHTIRYRLNDTQVSLLIDHKNALASTTNFRDYAMLHGSWQMSLGNIPTSDITWAIFITYELYTLLDRMKQCTLAGSIEYIEDHLLQVIIDVRSKKKVDDIQTYRSNIEDYIGKLDAKRNRFTHDLTIFDDDESIADDKDENGDTVYY